MPSVSKSQKAAAGLALSAKRGAVKVSSLKGAAKSMYISMTEEQLESLQGQSGQNYLLRLVGVKSEVRLDKVRERCLY